MKIPTTKTQATVAPPTGVQPPVVSDLGASTQAPVADDQAFTLLDTGPVVEFSKGPSDLLPQAKIPYPIEVGKNSITMGDCYKFCLFDGKTLSQVPVPYTLVMIDQRNASRVLNPEDNSYIRAYAGGKSDALYQDQCRSNPRAKGVTSIVAVLSAGGIAIAEFPTFGPSENYWAKPLSMASLKAKVGMQIAIADHSGNLTVSKSTGHSYMDPKKFKFAQTPLTPAQCQEIVAALKANWPQYLAWKAQ